MRCYRALQIRLSKLGRQRDKSTAIAGQQILLRPYDLNALTTRLQVSCAKVLSVVVSLFVTMKMHNLSSDCECFREYTHYNEDVHSTSTAGIVSKLLRVKASTHRVGDQ